MLYSFMLYKNKNKKSGCVWSTSLENVVIFAMIYTKM